MTEALAHLETLMRETHQPEAKVMALAFQTGLRQLWRERTLGRYLRGEITRDEASESAGIDWVELAERQHKAVMEDLAWAWGSEGCRDRCWPTHSLGRGWLHSAPSHL